MMKVSAEQRARARPRLRVFDEEAARELLEPHRKRSLSAFLGRAGLSDAELAFWELLYGDRTVEHVEVLALINELERDRAHTVGDVLDGWRPESLA